MADLIDREEVRTQMTKYGFIAPDMTIHEFVEDELSKIDAVPVVRCGECKYFILSQHEPYGLCDFYDGFTHKAMPDDFCSYGERKEGGDT